MQRLSLLVLGFLLAWLGARLVGSAGPFAPYLLRDALLLGMVGAVLFALNARGWEAPPVFRRLRGLPGTGRVLLWTGLLVALGGGAGLAAGLGGIGGLAANIAWWLGLLLQVVGAWWPGPAVDYAQPQVRWARDAAGKFVPLRRGVRAVTADPLARRRTWLLWLLGVLILAATLRFWDLGSLPPTCIAGECESALRVGAAPGGDLLEVGDRRSLGPPGGGVEMVAAALLPLTGSGLASLRLAGGIAGWLTVLFLAFALRRLAGPSAALLGTLLLAISPWHLWAGRTSDPWIMGALLVTLVLWLALEALARTHVRWWVPWGLAAGWLIGWLAGTGPQPLWLGGAAWAALVAALGLLIGLRRREHVGEGDLWQWPPAGVLAAVGMALGVGHGSAWSSNAALDPMVNLTLMAQALLRPELTAIGPFVAAGLVAGAVLALSVTGIGALVRHIRQAQAPVLLGGIVALAAGAAAMDLAAHPAGAGPASVLLPLLPLLLAAGTVALDVLLAALIATWGPPLVPASRLVTAGGLVLLLLVGGGTVALVQGLDAAGGGPGAAVESDMARFIGDQLAAAADDPAAPPVTYVVPRAAIDHPSLQLLAGAALADGRVQPLELGRTLPYTGLPAGNVTYLLPLLDGEVLNLLRQLYPAGEAATELDAGGAAARFNRFVVREADLRAAQSLQMTVRPGSETAAGTAAPAEQPTSPLAPPGQPQSPLAAPPAGTPGGFGEPISVAALDFAWGSNPPRALPFTAEWTGALAVPESGTYRFAVDSSAPESTFSLLLDDLLVLDSSLGMRDQQIELPQGIQRIRMSYRSGNQPGDLRVRWQTPDGAEQVLAAPSLHWPPLADQGLLAEYFAGEGFAGAPLAEHKDPVIGLDPGLDAPYSVRWYGLLAAPRAGEYLLGADAGGAVQVVVDGQVVADNRAGLAGAGDQSSYTEGLIYLSQGWHSFEVRFAPGAGEDSTRPTGAGGGGGAFPPAGDDGTARDPGIGPGDIRLLWQPPGSNPSALPALYLRPARGEIGPADAPLPPAPPLVDAILGDDRFALAVAADVWQPHRRVPPADLPPLPFESLWRAGGVCGGEPGQFNAPHGVAFAPGGDKIYVADTGNRRVVVYSIDGAPEASIMSELLQEPVAVEVTGDGTVLILDALAGAVFRAEADGSLTPLPQETGFYRPRGFGLDRESNMAIADTGGARVAIVQPDGVLAGQFGGQGSLLGRGQPVDSVVAEGALWAITAEDGRLWNLNVNGSFTAVQPTGTVDGPQLAELSDGRLLATDPARGSFVLFSRLGEPLGQFAYVGELVTPTGIAATRLGDGEVIAVADTRTCALTVWRLAQ